MSLVGQFESGAGGGTEIISVQAATHRAAVTNVATGSIEILYLGDPANPVLAASHPLGLSGHEGITSVAFHPTDDYYLVTVEVEGTTTNGRVELRDGTTGAVLSVLATGSEPDAVAIDRKGRRAVISNEGESFSFDAVTGEFDSPPGSVTIVDLRNGPVAATATDVALPDATGVAGFVSGADHRFLEREVDVNGNGIIDETVDYDGNSLIEDVEVLIGFIGTTPVVANETDGEVLLIPLVDNTPKFLEPEIAVFSKNGKKAFVAMQENNGVAIIDVVNGTFSGYFGLGITTHATDKTEDGFVDFSETLVALREPDGIAMSPDGLYLITADEGDTDPKASETPEGLPTAGGRTVSVFDAATGLLLGDTGNQIDEAAHAIWQYPDDRSDSKGSEPENLVAFKRDGITYVAVGLERADAVAIVSLADPANPTVVAIAAVNPGTELGSQAPEGVAFFRGPYGGNFVYSANEGSGVVSAFEVEIF